MRATWRPDVEGDEQRKFEKEQRAEGLLPISQHHELLFKTVCKKVITRNMRGMITDYRPPLFEVYWANGTKELFNKTELEHFMKLEGLQEWKAGKVEKRREERMHNDAIQREIRLTPGLDFDKHGLSAAQKLKLIKKASLTDSATMASTHSVLEWRLLEIGRAHEVVTEEAAKDLVFKSILEQKEKESSKESSKDGSSQSPFQPKSTISICGCPILSQPKTEAWIAAAPVLCSLSLVNCDFQIAPAGVRNTAELTNLQRLDLRLNHIRVFDFSRSEVPKTPSQQNLPPTLRYLQALNLSSNELGSDNGRLNPIDEDCLSAVPGLTLLDISCNEALQFLPRSISTLHQLEVLNVANCGLQSICKELWTCTKLLTLDFSSNRLRSLDEEKGDGGILVPSSPARLRYLETLLLGHNHPINRVPVEVWGMKSLRYLDLSGNTGVILPPDGKEVLEKNKIAGTVCSESAFAPPLSGRGKAGTKQKMKKEKKKKKNARDKDKDRLTKSLSPDSRGSRTISPLAMTLGTLGVDHTPAPLTELNLSQCSLKRLPPILLAAAEATLDVLAAQQSSNTTHDCSIAPINASLPSIQSSSGASTNPKSVSIFSAAFAANAAERMLKGDSSQGSTQTTVSKASTARRAAQEAKRNAAVEAKAEAERKEAAEALQHGVGALRILSLAQNELGLDDTSERDLRSSRTCRCAGLPPKFVEALRSLTRLDVSCNRIKAVPWELFGHATPHLDLEHASRRTESVSFAPSLPTSVPTLLGPRALVELDLSRNEIVHLPSVISDDIIMAPPPLPPSSTATESTSTTVQPSIDRNNRIPAPCAHSLRVLRLDHNKLTFLPESLGNLSTLHTLTVKFNDLRSVPESVAELKSSLKVIELDQNPRIGPPALKAALDLGTRETLRMLFCHSEAVSYAHKAPCHASRDATRVRRLAGGIVATDEAAIDKNMMKGAPDSDSEADSDSTTDSDDEINGEGNDRKRKKEAEQRLKKQQAHLDKKVLVYDQQGDLLDKLTQEAYMNRTYTLHYEAVN